jgi:succinate dehydrogenase / fumarate reductase cytochrome b subunit
MSSLSNVLNSTIGRKYLMGLSGLGMVGFALIHLLGNLALLVPDGGRSFNEYTAFLHGFGKLLYVAEVGLLLLFGLHIWMAFSVTSQNLAARPRKYEVEGDAGGKSRKSRFSQNMIVSGFILLAFLILHVLSFRFGPGWTVAEAKTESLQAMAVFEPHARDLAGLVVTRFKDPLYSLFYVFSMAVLFGHLRHGFWSSFQSLGALSPKWEPQIQQTGVALAVLLSVGFLLLPLWILIDPLGVYTELVRLPCPPTPPRATSRPPGIATASTSSW